MEAIHLSQQFCTSGASTLACFGALYPPFPFIRTRRFDGYRPRNLDFRRNPANVNDVLRLSAKQRNKLICFFSNREVFNIEAINMEGSVKETTCFQCSLKKLSGFWEHFVKLIRRSIAVSLLFVVIGLLPHRILQKQAVAIPFITLGSKKKKKISEHEFSHYTDSLLASVSVLLQRVKNAKVSASNKSVTAKQEVVAEVREALEGVKSRRAELQKEVFIELNGKLEKLRIKENELAKKAEGVYQRIMKMQNRIKMLKDSKRIEQVVMDKIKELEDGVRALEPEYSEIVAKVDEVEDEIWRRENRTYSIVARELFFIEKESEALVKKCIDQLLHVKPERGTKMITENLSASDIEQDLRAAQDKVLSQAILPKVVGIEDSVLPDPSMKEFVIRVKNVLEESKEMQRHLEGRVRRRTRRYEEEKRLYQQTPGSEAVKEFLEVDPKWKFDEEEVVIPNAASLELYHRWKKWREDLKKKQKKNLLKNGDAAKTYIARRQEHILVDRDRVVDKTWYHEEQKRWEMDPRAVPYALSKKIIDHVCVQHDWAAMYVILKGDDKEYFVDVMEFDRIFEGSGGFDGLYLRLLGSGVPTAVQWMWIPLSEMDIGQQLCLFVKLSYRILSGFWSLKPVSFASRRCYEMVVALAKGFNEDLVVMIGFPLLELVPKMVKKKLGMVWPEELDESVGNSWFLEWQSKAETNFRRRRKRTNTIWFVARSLIFGYIIFLVVRFLKRQPLFSGYGPFRHRNPNLKKLYRMKWYFGEEKKMLRQMVTKSVDPIQSAFDQMKRVKNPPVKLKDFASADSMREEINEVVAFLQNPKAFQEMGARAPRGVLIVGETGTGKTTLALAIAAEAKVPMVEVKVGQLEDGQGQEPRVGQSASNVRELFKTARDLAPVIIFIEDFDRFAGVRGNFLHTKKQDHEAFINQLLVELDGFETQDGVVLMATTNNPKQIDPALQRPGRMDRVFKLQRPTQLEREKILHLAAEETMDENLVDLVDWKKVAEKTSLLRPNDLKVVPLSLEAAVFRNKFLDSDELMSYRGWFATLREITPEWFWKSKLMKQASRRLVNYLGLTLTKEDLGSVVELMEPYGQISDGIELFSPPGDWTRATKFPHAVWAVGRGLLALLLPNFDEVEYIWLEPLKWEGIGCTKITRAKHDGSRIGTVETRSYLEKKLVFLFGSYVASEMLLSLGDDNDLSASEIQEAEEISVRMVIQYGWGPDDNPAAYFTSITNSYMGMGDKQELEIASKVKELYDYAYDKAKELLSKNRKSLAVMVEWLLDHEVLSATDMLKILHEHGGSREMEPFTLTKQIVEELPNESSNGAPTYLLVAHA